jgi:hypothetical protein
MGGGTVLSGVTANGPFLVDSAPDGGGWIVDYPLAAGTADLSVEVYAVCATVSSQPTVAEREVCTAAGMERAGGMTRIKAEVSMGEIPPTRWH